MCVEETLADGAWTGWEDVVLSTVWVLRRDDVVRDLGTALTALASLLPCEMSLREVRGGRVEERRERRGVSCISTGDPLVLRGGLEAMVRLISVV